VVTILVVVADTTVAGVPLKLTAFAAALALNPVPKIVTVSPTRPRVGVKDTMEIAAEDWRETERMFPASS
jgi:hypothetical protein